MAVNHAVQHFKRTAFMSLVCITYSSIYPVSLLLPGSCLSRRLFRLPFSASASHAGTIILCYRSVLISFISSLVSCHFVFLRTVSLVFPFNLPGIPTPLHTLAHLTFDLCSFIFHTLILDHLSVSVHFICVLILPVLQSLLSCIEALCNVYLFTSLLYITFDSGAFVLSFSI